MLFVSDFFSLNGFLTEYEDSVLDEYKFSSGAKRSLFYHLRHLKENVPIKIRWLWLLVRISLWLIQEIVGNIISQGSVHFYETFSGSPKARKDFTEMSFTVSYYETDTLVGSLFKSLAELPSDILINLSHCAIDGI